MKTLNRILILSCFAPTMLFAQVDRTEHDSQRNLENVVSDDGYTVPDEIRKDFESRYPDSEVTNLTTSENRYTIEYEKDGKLYTSFYDSQNNWIETHEHISYNDLSSEAKNSFIGTQYKDSKVDEVSIVSNGNDKEFYQLNIEQNGTPRNLYISEDGTLMDGKSNPSPTSYDTHPGKPGSGELGDRNRILNEPNRIDNRIQNSSNRNRIGDNDRVRVK